MDHWMQGVNIDKFQSYDYGNPIQNQRKYGQSTPPAYDLSRFVLKVSFSPSFFKMLSSVIVFCDSMFELIVGRTIFWFK